MANEAKKTPCEIAKAAYDAAIKAADDHLEFLQKMMDFVTNNGALEKCLELPLEDIPAFIGEKLG